MRRSLLAVPVVALLAVGVLAAAVTGAFSSGAGAAPGRATAAAATTATTATTTMAMPVTGLSAKLTVELHRAVVRVVIHNFAFAPARLEVSRGTRIVWTNEDDDPHTVTTDKPAWASPALDTGQRFTVVARKPGTFTYHCQIHPFMHGAVIVAA